jgi:hypothetical protein
MFGISKNLSTLIKGSAIILCLPFYAWGPPVLAQEGLKIELNKLESVEGACRAYMLFENKSGTAFDSLKLDLVMFDPNGVINKRLAVEGAPLPVGKTSVKLFDIKDLACAEVDRILLNDVLSCRGPAGEISDCLVDIDTTSRNSVLFFK